MKVPIIQESIRGEIPQNFYPAADQEKGVILLPSPGLLSFVELPYCSQIRGGIVFGDFIYAVGVVGNTSRVWKIDLSGGYTEIGTINSGRGPVWTEKNHYQIAFVDGTNGQQMYVYNTLTGVFGRVTDLDFPGAIGLGYQDGYGIIPVPDSLRWYISASYDFTNWDALDFVSIEGQPGNIVGLISDHREVWPMNAEYSENWRNTGGTFPFSRTVVSLEDGLGAAKSLIKADNSISWITSKGQVVKLDGYVPKIISNQKIADEIAGYPLYTDAIGYSLTWRGHLWCVWHFPTADRTLVYDAATGVWWRWSSGTEGGRHLGNCYFNIGNRHFVGGDSDGTIWELKDNVYTDGGETIRRKFMFQAPTPDPNGWHSFPFLQLDWDQGVGLEDTTIPQSMLRISDDGGKTWGSEWWEEAGQVGETTCCTRHDGLGGIQSHQERIYEVTVTDAIPWKLLGVKHPILKG